MRLLYPTAILLLSTIAVLGESPSHEVDLEIANERVPPGAMAQIKVFVVQPRPIASASIVLSLDSAIFGDIAGLEVHSATGDQAGYALVEGRKATISFDSSTAGPGRLRGLPILTVVAPVLETAIPGAKAEIGLGSVELKDPAGEKYSVRMHAGGFEVGGSLSVTNVTPGGGYLPAGAQVHIDGTGFTPQTSLEIEGVVIASTRFIANDRIEITLGAPAEMAGKRVSVREPGGELVEYFCSLRGEVVRPDRAPLSQIHPILPRITQALTAPRLPSLPGSSSAFAVRNPNLEPADVVVESLFGDLVAVRLAFSVPPSGVVLCDCNFSRLNTTRAISSLPVEMLALNYQRVGPPWVLSVSSPPPSFIPPLELAANANLEWDWQIGAALPESRSFTARSGSEQNFQMDVATANGGSWLTATASALMTPATVTVNVNPTGLVPGTYRGAIRLTPDTSALRPVAKTLELPVTLTVGATPLLTVSPSVSVR